MKGTDKLAFLLAEEQNKVEWNKKVYKYLREIDKLQKPNSDDSRGIDEVCKKYFEISENYGIMPSVAGLGRALGVSRSVLLKWANGEITIRTADVVAKYLSYIEIFDETALKDNRTNAVAGLFNMKNNYDYKDEVIEKRVIEEQPSNKEIEQKYMQMHEIVEARPHEIDYTQEQVVEPPKVEKKPKSKSKKKTSNNDIPF